MLLQAATTLAGVPRGELPPIAALFLPNAPRLAIGLGVLGDLLWVVAYILAIRIGFKQRTYGFPLVAIALNFTWELVFGVLHPPAAWSARIPHLMWFLVDCLIVWQLFRYGRARQVVPQIQRAFYPVVIATFVLAVIGQILYQDQATHNAIFRDTGGNGTAYLMNFVMSILFLGMLFSRPDGNGLSLGVAWTKMIGTLCISIGNVLIFAGGSPIQYNVQIQKVGTEQWELAGTVGASTVSTGFYYYLFIAILIFDLIYLRLLYHARRTAPTAGQPLSAPSSLG